MSTIKNQRCFTEATASARLILATGLVVFILHVEVIKPRNNSEAPMGFEPMTPAIPV